MQAHHDNWRSATGCGRGLSPAELQRLLPDEVLPERSLWPLVIERVDREPHVRRRATADSAASSAEIEWEWVGH